MDIWEKAIINSCINPLTAILDIKNGEILEHDALLSIAEKTCMESIRIAQGRGIPVEEEKLLKNLREVLRNTSDNLSSMVQSLRKGKRTEIDSINGCIAKFGKEIGAKTELNDLLIKLVKIREKAGVVA